MVSDSNKPIANSSVVLREEFDDWAILFDPDSGGGFGLNPVSVFIWKNLDGKHTVEDILVELRKNCENVPQNAEDYIRNFIQELVEGGLAGYEFKEG